MYIIIIITLLNIIISPAATTSYYIYLYFMICSFVSSYPRPSQSSNSINLSWLLSCSLYFSLLIQTVWTAECSYYFRMSPSWSLVLICLINPLFFLTVTGQQYQVSTTTTFLPLNTSQGYKCIVDEVNTKSSFLFCFFWKFFFLSPFYLLLTQTNYKRKKKGKIYLSICKNIV